MFEIILIIYLAFRNSVKAKLKGQKSVLWAFFTVVAFFVAEMIGILVVFLVYLKNKVDFNMLANNPNYKEEATQIFTQELRNNPILYVSLNMFGLGGYLLVRYLLDRKPDINNDNMNWMDKLNNRQNDSVN